MNFTTRPVLLSKRFTDLFAALVVLTVSLGMIQIGSADTNLSQWSITATTGATNTGVSNFVSGFTASQLVSGTNLFTAGTNLTPNGTWYRLYTNSPNQIPTTGLRALSLGDYFTFNTVISAGWNIEVDAISGLILGKTSSTATNAALYYSTNSGTSWLQAGGTAIIPAFTGTNDYSSSINTGTGTNTYFTGGVTNIVTNSGLTTAPVDFNNSSSGSDLTIKWAIAFWGAGTGRLGIGNGGNLLTLSGIILSGGLTDLFVGTNSTVASTNFTSGTSSFSNAYVGYTTDSSNNTLTVGNSGTTLSLQNTTYLGYTGASNSLIISNGGVLSDNYAYIGHSNSSSNNSAVVTGSGSLWTNSGDLTVGDLGSGNSLTISNSAKVVSVNGVIGNQSSASNNSVVVTGAGSSWSNSGLLFIGAGAGNSLTVSNGGVVSATYLGIQQGSGASSNTVTITGSNSQALISGLVEIGSTASNSGAQLIISAGGTLTNGGNAVVGTTNGAAQGNSVLITDSNSIWKVGGNFALGNGSGGNTLVLSNGATLANSNGYIGLYGGSNNSATVMGTGSGWSNSADFYVGYQGGNNSLVLSNGATLSDRSGYLGYTNSDSNSAIVTDAGSSWSNNNGVVVGYYSSGNSLTVSNSASVISQNKVTLGYTPSASNNSIVVTAGGSINDGTTDLNVGRAGSGNTLTISGGGTITDGNAYLGATNTSSNNFVLVTDSNSVFSSSQNLNIGYGGTGSLTISNSATVVDLGAYIGNQSNSVGSVNVNAATWSNAGYLEVGVNGSGSLSISGGGTVTDSNGIIGNAGGSSGAVTVTGVGSLWSNSTALYVGNSGSGSLTISGTGTVTAGSSGITLAGNSGSIGTLNIGTLGGSDTAGGASLVSPTIAFGSGTGTLNFNQSDSFTLTSSISGNGTVQQLGSGTTIVSGNSSYTGTTLITNGTLQASSANALGSSTVTLTGTGVLSVVTNLTVSTLVWNSSATLSLSPNTYLTSLGAVSLNGGGTHNFNLTGWSLGGTPMELLAYGSGSFTTNDFGALGVSGFTLSLSNSALWISANVLPDLYVGSNSTVPSTNFTSGTTNFGNTFVGFATNASNNLLTVGNSGTILSNSTTAYIGYQGASNSLIISNGSILADNYAYVGHSNSSSNNSALVTGPASLWTNSGDLTVGDLGAGNSLTISKGATVVSTDGVIGNQSTSSNNSVVVTGSGSTWSNNGLLFIGAGAGNSLTASNGGVVTATYLGIQQGAGTGSNTVTITGSNSQALISGVVEIGSTASNSGAALIISAGGSLTNGGNAVVGTTNGAAQGNSVLITDSNSTWKVGGNFNFGNGSGGNTLVISNGATLANSNGYIGIYGGSSNSATVTANSLWSNSADFYVGYNGGSNSLIISGSSTLTDRRGYLGYLGYTNSDSNSALVTDAGSTWINTNGIVVGYYSSGNSLTVSNAASVVSSNKVTLGYTASSSNNSIVVTAGGSINDGTTDLNVGRAGSGNTLTISGGGTVTDGNAYLGATNTSSNNFVLVTDSNSVFSSSQNLNIGYGGTGSLTISNSATVVDLGAYIGNQSNSVGSVNVNAATWSNAGYLEVGVNGSGSLSISGGGTVTDSNGIIGNAGGSSGAVTVTGVGSLWTNSSALTVGNAGSGTVTIGSGGTVAAPTLYIAASNTSVGTVNVGTFGGVDSNVSLLTPVITFGGGTGTLNFNQSDTVTVNSTITGQGVLNQLGSGTTILSGSNSYSGTTLVDGGELLITGSLSNSANIFVGGSNSSVSMEISNGQVQNGSSYIGFRTNSSNNSVLVTGGSALWSNSANLTVGAGGSYNTLTISNGGHVIDATGYIDSPITESSNDSVLVTGSGSLWSNSADLHVGNGASYNTLTISNGGQVVDSNGYIDAPEAFSSNNAVVVTGTNSLWSNSGVLYVGNGGSGNTLTVSNGATVSVNGDVKGFVIGFAANSSNNMVVVTGSNSLLTNASQNNDTFNVGWAGSSNSLMISNGGTVSTEYGNIGYTNGTGNSVIVTGSNSTWNGSELYVGHWNSGNSLLVTNGGKVLLDSYLGVGSFQPGANSNSVVVDGANSSLSVGSSGEIDVGGENGYSNSLVVKNGGSVFSQTAIIGAYGGDPNLSSNNTVVVTGSNSVWTNTGDFIVGQTGGSNSLVVSNGGTVSVGGDATIGDQATSSNNSVVITGSNSLLSISGTLTVGNSGSGSLTIAGGSVGANNTVIGANAGSVGTVTLSGGEWNNNFGQLYIGNSGTGTFTISGSGTLHNTLAVSLAQNSGSVGTLNIGTLGGNDNAGQINTLQTVTFGSGSGTINFNQINTNSLTASITGVGAINQLGKGTTILFGNNSYTGTTTISGGTLQANSTNALGTSSVLLNGGTLAVNTLLTIGDFNWSTTNSTVAINNPGKNYLNVTGVLNVGSGFNFIFSLFNYTSTGTPVELLAYGSNNELNDDQFGINNVSGYSLFTSNNALWILTTNGGLIASNTVTTVGGTQTNPNVTFQPGGVLNITPSGNLTITGGVNVTNNGTVTLNGTLNAPFVYVASGGTLGGSGLLNGNVTNNGTVSPGNSPGTLTVHGNYTQTQNGNLLIQIASPSVFDQVMVSGKALLGGRLIVTPYNGFQLAFGQKFGFLTASSITGSFSEIDAPAGYRARVTIVGDPVAYINLAPASYTQLAASPNQYQVAKALDSFIPATSGDQLVVSTTLDSLTASQYQAAFNAIAPSIYQSESTIAFNLANAQNQELLQRLWGVRVAGTGFSMSGFADNTMVVEGQGDGGKGVLDSKKDILRPGADNHWGMFVDGNGIFATANSGNMLPNYNSQSGGVTTGMTYKWNDSFGTGIYAGYEGSYAKYNGGSTLIDNSVRFGLFGTYGHPDGKGFYADGLIGGGYNNYQVSRNISFGTLNRTANSTPGAGELDSMLAGGYDIKKGNWTYGPTTSLQYTYFGANPVNETGAQSLDFNSSGWNTSSLLYSLGAHVAYSWQANKDVLVVPQISLSWQHEFLQSPYSVNGSLGGSPTFSNTSATPIRDTLYTGVGFTVELYKKWNTSLFYNASAGNSDLTSQNIFWSAGVKF